MTEPNTGTAQFPNRPVDCHYSDSYDFLTGLSFGAALADSYDPDQVVKPSDNPHYQWMLLIEIRMPFLTVNTQHYYDGTSLDHQETTPFAEE
jgi:hypothetical protein